MTEKQLKIVFFGSSLASAYWNGAATYYRGLCRALHQRGHRIRFFEPDAFDRQQHRDISDPDYARVHVYSADGKAEVKKALHTAREADVIVKASGVGVFDQFMEAAVPELKTARNCIVYWDVDAPATLAAMRADPQYITYLGHVFTADHNAFNCSPLAVLNINRQSMADVGFFPATRIFEAAGAGACLITDAWPGIDQFLAPGSECLVARDGEQVAEILEDLDQQKAARIGQAARQRISREHTYAHRARQVEEIFYNFLEA